MRPDMDRVIVERPRIHSRTAPKEPKGYKKRLQGDWEELPAKESMSANRKHGWEAKELNENLNPLRRFLQKQVGRPWDKVFAELSEQIDMNSTVKRHIWQHVFDTIEQHTFIGSDGNVWVHGKYGMGDTPLTYSRYQNLYIHPVDGLLKKIKKPKGWKPYKYRPDDRKDVRKDGENNLQFHKMNGIWYVIQLASYKGPLNTYETIPAENCNAGCAWTSRSYERVTPTAEGKIRDVVIKRRLADLYDDKNKRDVSFSRVIKTSDHSGPRGWRSHTFKNNGIEYISYEDTLTGLYGRKGVYATSFKQANSNELRKVGLKNDPQEAE